MHRYLTGQYAKVDSFTGRHKKEVCYDGQSHLLLIRNETGPPDLQVFQYFDDDVDDGDGEKNDNRNQ